MFDTVKKTHRGLITESDYRSLINNAARSITLSKFRSAIWLALRAERGSSATDGRALYLAGFGLNRIGKTNSALRILSRSLKKDRNLRGPRNTMGSIYLSRGRPDIALLFLEIEASLHPDSIDAIFNLGLARKGLGNLGHAVPCFEKVIIADPSRDFLHGELIHTADQICSWSIRETYLKNAFDLIRNGVCAIEPWVVVTVTDDPVLQRLAAENYAKKLEHVTLDSKEIRKIKSDPIRVAFLSSDYYAHATMWLMFDLLRRIDSSCFEVFLVDLSDESRDKKTQAVRRLGHNYISLGKVAKSKAISFLRSLDLDVAVDLKGHTGKNRFDIIEGRIAPNQIGFLGYPGTSGGRSLDYIIGDDTTIPIGEERHFTENVLRLNPCFQPNDFRRFKRVKEQSDLSGVVPPGAFVFGSLGAQFKITRDMLLAWIQILSVCDKGFLVILADNAEAKRNLTEFVLRNSPSVISRVTFVPRTQPEVHLSRYRSVALSLDTFPCGGHTTASDSLGMGVPMVSLEGRSFASRVGSSLLRERGLEELVCRDLSSYVTRSISLYRNPRKLKDLTTRLRSFNQHNEKHGREYCEKFETLIKSVVFKNRNPEDCNVGAVDNSSS